MAGGLHGVATPEHWAEWWGYAAVFVAAAVAQVLLGLLLLTQGVSPERGLAWADVRGRVYLWGLLGNLSLLLLCLLTRTVGVPAGPAAGEVEVVGGLDLGTKVAEAVAVLLLAMLWRGSRRPSVRSATDA